MYAKVVAYGMVMIGHGLHGTVGMSSLNRRLVREREVQLRGTIRVRCRIFEGEQSVAIRHDVGHGLHGCGGRGGNLD